MRDFLEKNRVYFEVISSIMFGVAAFLISLASFSISKKQLNESKITNHPHFYIQTELHLDVKTRRYNDRILKIYNGGSPVHNIDINKYEFIEVDYFQEDKNKIYVPANGAYFIQEYTHSPTGLISTFRGNNNNSVISQLDRFSLEYTQMRPDYYFEFKFITVISIAYTGRDSERYNTYFFDRDRVSENSVKDMIKIHKNSALIDIESATVEKILDAAKKLK